VPSVQSKTVNFQLIDWLMLLKLYVYRFYGIFTVRHHFNLPLPFGIRKCISIMDLSTFVLLHVLFHWQVKESFKIALYHVDKFYFIMGTVCHGFLVYITQCNVMCWPTSITAKYLSVIDSWALLLWPCPVSFLFVI